MNRKGLAGGILLLVAAIFIAGDIKAQTVEERVSDEIKAKELRKAAEVSPRALLSRARTVYVDSSTSFFEAVQLQNALLKREEFDMWQMAIVDGGGKRDIADMLIEVDRPLFTFTFTYKIIHRSTGVLLSTGKVTAFDSSAAAPKIARRIVDEIRKARGEPKSKK